MTFYARCKHSAILCRGFPTHEDREKFLADNPHWYAVCALKADRLERAARENGA